MPAPYGITKGVRVYMDELCHWLRIEDSKSESYIVSFDMSNEVFFTTHIPSDIDDSVDKEFYCTHQKLFSLV